MRTLIIALLLLGTLHAAEPVHFAVLAPIQGDLTPQQPVRVPLPAELIRQTRTGFPDLRVFDDQGRETPYVIHTRQRVQDGTRTFTFDLVAYDRQEEIETLVLQRPDAIRAITRLQIQTAARDFRRHLRIATSDDRQQWEPLLEDVIFDFSSRVDLRRTAIDLPATDARFLRLILDQAGGSDGMERLQLQYQDLKLDVAHLQTGAFKIDRVQGTAGQHVELEAAYDSLELPNPTAHHQQQSTDLLLGQLNLPIEQLELHIADPFFHRQVQLASSQTGEDDDWTRRHTDTLYRLPGVREAKTQLTPRLGRTAYLQLHIVNGDSPPLNVERVEVRWLRRELCFIPEAGRTYTLYAGNAKLAAPRYDTAHLIPYQAPRIAAMPAASLGQVGPNPRFDADAPVSDAEATARHQRLLLTALVIVVSVLLAAWLFHLLRGMQASEPDQT